MNDNRLEIKNTEGIRFIVDRRYRPARYILFLVGAFIIICFTRQITDYPSPYNYYRLACIYIAIIFLSLANMNFLVPKLFFKGKYLFYFFCLLVLVAGGLTLLSKMLHIFSYQQHEGGLPPYDNKGIYEGIIMLSPIILVTTMIKLFQRWIKDTGRISELNNIRLTTELAALKNQINPHFLFNMLNGIKALVRIDQERATTAIIKLSELLRYQLYENNEQKTSLKSEIDFLSNFLDLEKIRRDNFSVNIQVKANSQNINNIFLPPGLFTVFVENAVKHSVNISQDPSYIYIEFAVDGRRLSFNCTNSIDTQFMPHDKNGGLGLINITRRLQLLYEGEYVYDVIENEKEYLVKLTLPL